MDGKLVEEEGEKRQEAENQNKRLGERKCEDK